MIRLLVPVLALLTLSGATAAERQGPLVLAFGDSLIAGYGLEAGLGFAPQLQATLRRHGIAATVDNAGVSGDTTTAGRARLEWTLAGLPRKPDLVILELGGNDMLRGIDPALVRGNLDAMLADLERQGIPVLLAGMRAIRNVDPAYGRQFEAIYADLAREHGVPFHPFFLDGAALVPGMMQDDGIHPTFEGVKQIVTRITPAVKAELGS